MPVCVACGLRFPSPAGGGGARGGGLPHIAVRIGGEGVDETLEGGEEAQHFLVIEGAGEAEVADIVGGQVRGALLRGGAEEGVMRARGVLEVAPEAVAAMWGAGGPARQVVARLAQASFEDLPGIVATERRFIQPEPGEVEATDAVRRIQRAEEDFGAIGQRQMPLDLLETLDERGVLTPGERVLFQQLEEGALGGVA